MPSPPSCCQSLLFPNTTIGDVTSPHSHLNFQVPEVSSEEFLLSRPIRCELSRFRCHGHSLLLSSYLHRISRKENSACSACGHPLQDLNHFLRDCLPLNPFVNLSLAPLSLFLTYGPYLGVWPDCWVVAEFICTPIPRKGSDSTTHHPDCMILGSTRTLVKDLRPWIRRLIMMISAWWL